MKLSEKEINRISKNLIESSSFNSMKFFSDKNLIESESLELEDEKENQSNEENETKSFIKHLQNVNQDKKVEISSIHSISYCEDNLFDQSFNNKPAPEKLVTANFFKDNPRPGEYTFESPINSLDFRNSESTMS